jgi:hypothetical protein
MTKATTLGELKQTEWASPARRQRTVKDEMRDNLVCLLENGSPLFPGSWAYDDTVIRAERDPVAAQLHFVVGLRGRRAASCGSWCCCWTEIPVLAGSEVNDDPFQPISKDGRERIAELGDATPIAWLPRESRYVEKLATPDVTIADLIGDIDPIKAATLRLDYSDERVIHYGIIPRTNRGIFAINERRTSRSGIVQRSCRKAIQISIPCGCPRRGAAVHRQPQDYTRAQITAVEGPDRLRDRDYPLSVDLARHHAAGSAVDRLGRPVRARFHG